MSSAMKPCCICETEEVPRFEAGGEWWCDDCAELQTDISAGRYGERHETGYQPGEYDKD